MIINKKNFSALGIENLPSEKQEELVNKLEDIILEKLSIEAVKKLSIENRGKYFQLLKSAMPIDIYNFLSKNISNFEKLAQQIAEEVVADFKK
ncbi:hypothetical protein DRN69_01925 [Candidatus Pacearchaeota archaeon]|nr:MAG: hypothetical protein DRN69_01925 [Candidatus Pacearchaeota archaeon]